MAVVERVSHQVGVMYLGRIVEIGPRAAVFETPQHPYTKALMKVVPIADSLRRKKEKSKISNLYHRHLNTSKLHRAIMF